MEFTGRIRELLPMRSGTSARTGNEWYAQPFVFEYFENPTDRYADSVVLETFDANIIPHLKVGMELRIGFSHKAKPIKKQDGTDTIINEMRVYKIESVRGANQPAGGANDGGAGNQPTPQQNAAQTAPFPPAVDANGNPTNHGGQDDDLTF